MTPPRYRITVNRDLLAKTPQGDDPKHQARPIRVNDTQTGETTEHRAVGLPMGAEVVYGDPQQDGARVWIEAPGLVDRG